MEMISIITPVYNAMNYLHQCIDSILGQTYRNWELILVDDQSPDESGKICDDYAAKDERIRVIHQKWGGVSSARNNGLNAAKGHWVTFIDADDLIGSDYLQHLQQQAKADYIVSGYKSFPELKESKLCDVSISYIIEKLDFTNETTRFLFYFPWAKLYKTKIIREYGLLFPEHIRLSEDTCFIIRYMAHCEKISIIPYTDYYYRSQASMSKYLLNCSELFDHLAELNSSIDYFEGFKSNKLQYIKKNISTILFYYYKDFLYSVGYREYKQNVGQWTRNNWNVFSRSFNESSAKKALYKFIVMNPFAGFVLTRILKCRA